MSAAVHVSPSRFCKTLLKQHGNVIVGCAGSQALSRPFLPIFPQTVAPLAHSLTPSLRSRLLPDAHPVSPGCGAVHLAALPVKHHL
jgi:hypothetical protein